MHNPYNFLHVKFCMSQLRHIVTVELAARRMSSVRHPFRTTRMAAWKEERIAETAEQNVYVKKLKYNQNPLFNQAIGKGWKAVLKSRQIENSGTG